MSLPTEPYSRIERYLAKLAGQEVAIPDKPITRIECYLDYLVNNGAGIEAGAGAKNSIFGGKSLGGILTTAQRAAISDGTFDGLSVGDYWEMPWGEGDTPPLVKFRIAGFDLLLGTGETPMATHHAVIVPDSVLGTSIYATGEFAGYSGSTLKTFITTDIVPGLETLFGTLLSYSIRVRSSQGSTAWLTSKADAMSTCSVLSTYASTTYLVLGNSMFLPFPLFSMAPWFIPTSGAGYWFQEAYSNTSGMVISAEGLKVTQSLTDTLGVRPFFLIGSTT